MWEWLDELGEWLGTRAAAKERRWLHRHFRLSGPVVEWLGSPARSNEQRLAFTELLLRLDADPVGNSVAILRPGSPPGMRWAPFDNHRAIFVLDMGAIRFESRCVCERSAPMSVMQHFPTVTDHGVVTHVLVPIGIYEQLTAEHAGAMRPPSESDIDAAIAIVGDPGAEWQDAEHVLRRMVREGVEQARRERDITQQELGALIGLSQPQVSRIEKNPESVPLGTLRRIAEALARASSRGMAGPNP